MNMIAFSQHTVSGLHQPIINTVDSEISRGVYFRETSRMRSYAHINLSRNGKFSLPFTDVGKSCPSTNF